MKNLVLFSILLIIVISNSCANKNNSDEILDKSLITSNYNDLKDKDSVTVQPKISFPLGHEYIQYVNFSPDENYIISTGYKKIIIWDINSGKQINYFPGKYKRAELSKDNKYIIAQIDENKNETHIINTLTGKIENIYKDDWQSPFNEWNIPVEISEDKLSKFIELTGIDKHYVKDTKRWNSIESIAFSKDQRFAISGGGVYILLWDLEKKVPLKKFNSEAGRINSIDISSDGKLFCVGGYDKTTRYWDLANGIQLESDYQHEWKVNSVKFMPGDTTIISGSQDGTVKLWNIYDDNNRIKTCSTHLIGWNAPINYKPSISSVDCSPDGKYILSSDADHRLCVWKPDDTLSFSKTNDSIHLRGSFELLGPCSFSPDGKVLGISTSFITYFYDFTKINDSKPMPCITFSNRKGLEMYLCVKFSDDSQYAVTLSDNNIDIWDFYNNKHQKRIENKVSIISPAPDLLAVSKNYIASPDNRIINLWDIHSGSISKSFQQHDDKVSCLDITNDEKFLLSGSEDKTIRLWDIESGEEIVKFIPLDSINWITTTPDGYYRCSKQTLQTLSYSIGLQSFPYDQFDLQYNRPDIVLERIGLAPKELIESYRKAYYKRLKKMNFNESNFNKDFHFPEIEILNKESFAYQTETKSLKFKLNAKDSKYKLDRINIWVNNIPLYGMNGMSVKKLGTDVFLKEFDIELNSGINKIQVSTLNEKGVESFKDHFEILYNPEIVKKPDLYIIAISISDYEYINMNLQYAAKDGRDIIDNYLSHKDQYANILIDTLFNQSAKREAILSLKEKLLKTKTDDQVILYVSGHGLLDENFDFYFATHDIDFSNPSERGVSYDELEWLLDSIPARKKLFLMDACHSGEVDKEELIAYNAEKEEGIKSGVKKYTYKAGILQDEETSGLGLQNSFELMQELFSNLNRGSGSVVISAAAGDSYAMESDEWKNGVFTYSILNGLKSEEADLNKNGEITVSELRDYVSQSVQNLTNGLQKPTMRQENVEFDFRVW